jgi:hypothetical protein
MEGVVIATAESPDPDLLPFAALDLLTSQALAMQAVCIAYVGSYLEDGLVMEFESYMRTISRYFEYRIDGIGAYFRSLAAQENPARGLAIEVSRYTALAGSAVKWANFLKLLSLLAAGLSPSWGQRDELASLVNGFAEAVMGNKVAETQFEKEGVALAFSAHPYVGVREIQTARNITMLGDKGQTVSMAAYALANLANLDPERASGIAERLLKELSNG